jgi:drug/metabolite transporter (DMT)-like permease
MTELLGVAAALLGSVLGGTAAAASRYAVGIVNPLAVTTLRYTIGAVCLLAFAVPAARKFEDFRRFLAAVGLSIVFYALYPYLFTLSFAYTTAEY